MRRNDSSKAHVDPWATPNLPSGLGAVEAAYLNGTGMKAPGLNPKNQTDGYDIWISEDGPNTFTFMNNATNGTSLILVVWDHDPESTTDSSFLTMRAPNITHPIPHGQNFTISVANNVSGAWAAMYVNSSAPEYWPDTNLNKYGQVNGTWGEFKTGRNATIAVSRLVNMRGRPMSVDIEGSKCVANHSKCAFTCYNHLTCDRGVPGDYYLSGCNGTYVEDQSYWVVPSEGCEKDHDEEGCDDDDEAEDDEQLCDPNMNDGLKHVKGGCIGWSDGGHLGVVFF